MVQKIQQQSLSMGILDPQMMSIAVMKYSREEAVDYLARAISRFARREYIMFTHNPGNHCIPPVNQVSLRYAILAQLHISRLAKLSLIGHSFHMPHIPLLQVIIGYWWLLFQNGNKCYTWILSGQSCATIVCWNQLLMSTYILDKHFELVQKEDIFKVNLNDLL